MTENLQVWATGVGVSLALGILLRFAKKHRWAEKCNVAGHRLGFAFSRVLLGWLPPKRAEAAEEGFIVTALNWAGEFLLGFERGMLADNNERKRGCDDSKAGKICGVVLLAGLALLSGCAKERTNYDWTHDIATKSAESPVELGEHKGGAMYGGARYEQPEPAGVQPVEGTLYFGFDSYRLSPVEAMKVDQIIAKAAGRDLMLKGGACPLGTHEYNYGLGMKRAIAIRDYMIDCGYTGRIRIMSFGEMNLVHDDPRYYWKSRRVEVAG